jgi:hypothetical protein
MKKAASDHICVFHCSLIENNVVNVIMKLAAGTLSAIPNFIYLFLTYLFSSSIWGCFLFVCFFVCVFLNSNSGSFKDVLRWKYKAGFPEEEERSLARVLYESLLGLDALHAAHIIHRY